MSSNRPRVHVSKTVLIILLCVLFSAVFAVVLGIALGDKAEKAKLEAEQNNQHTYIQIEKNKKRSMT